MPTRVTSRVAIKGLENALCHVKNINVTNRGQWMNKRKLIQSYKKFLFQKVMIFDCRNNSHEIVDGCLLSRDKNIHKSNLDKNYQRRDSLCFTNKAMKKWRKKRKRRKRRQWSSSFKNGNPARKYDVKNLHSFTELLVSQIAF